MGRPPDRPLVRLDWPPLAARLEWYRIRHKISRRELARRLGCNESHLGMLMRDELHPGADLLLSILYLLYPEYGPLVLRIGKETRA